MKTSRICAGVVATLALFAAGHATAAPGDGAGAAGGTTVVLNTFQTVWLKGAAYPGPQQNGLPKIGKNTGAGIMDGQFTFDASNPASIALATTFTRSAAIKNQNAANDSYMQGGVAFATLTDKGVAPGAVVDLPRLTGERTWMRPQVAFGTKAAGGKFAIGIAASEDNGVNNNPQPVLFLMDAVTGAIVGIPNNTRGGGVGNLTKPTNLIQQALKDGINVQNPNNQRGPHSIAQTGPNTWVVGMQYNNQAQEAFSVTVADSGAVKMNWLKRYSNVAQHCRPQVVVEPGATVGYIGAVEANNQPAEIGFRLTRFNVATGQAEVSKVAVKSDPKTKKYVAEPTIAMIGGKIAIGYGLTAVGNKPKGNGHGDYGSQVAALALFDATTLSIIGEPMLNAASVGRHAHMFSTTYGPNAEPALAYIGGSSTGTKGAFEQLIPLKADGSLGLKDSAKLYAVSSYSDVANVQARGKRNPQDQARGFINGLGAVANPGYQKGNTAFMPEVKTFSFSTVTGYENAAEADVGKRNSLWLSLVPASWDPAFKTTPGTPTDKPGTGPDGLPSTTGPAPRSTTPPTDPSGEAATKDDTNVLEGTEATGPDGARTRDDGLNGGANSGCSVSNSSTSSSSGAGFIFLAVAGVIIALRRKNEEV